MGVIINLLGGGGRCSIEFRYDEFRLSKRFNQFFFSEGVERRLGGGEGGEFTPFSAPVIIINLIVRINLPMI